MPLINELYESTHKILVLIAYASNKVQWSSNRALIHCLYTQTYFHVDEDSNQKLDISSYRIPQDGHVLKAFVHMHRAS